MHSRKHPGLVATVDDCDYELLAKFRWNPSRNRNRVYAITGAPCAPHRLMHCQILGVLGVDHINGDGLDNRRCNLRVASIAQNAHNARPYGRTSHFKGVCKQGERWAARIYKDRVSYNLGFWFREEDAARAYDQAARSLYGDFAWLNFPADTTAPTGRVGPRWPNGAASTDTGDAKKRALCALQSVHPRGHERTREIA